MVDLPQEVLQKLFAVLKKWSEEGMDAFRYEMFARRLVAAEYGRTDAVEWALAWYNDLLAEERQEAEARQRELLDNQEREAQVRADFEQGRCSNPNYQVFLDTVEHPELLTSHAPYMAWIARLRNAFEGIRGIKDLPEAQRRSIWQGILQKERDENLAPRLLLGNTQ